MIIVGFIEFMRILYSRTPIWLKSTLRNNSIFQALKNAGSLRDFVKLFLAYVSLKLKTKFDREKHNNNIVFVHIDSSFADVQDNRYYYFVLFTFVEAGYHLLLYKEKKISFEEFVCLKKYQRKAYRLPNVNIVHNLPSKIEDKILLSNQDSKYDREKWHKILRLNCDISVVADPNTSLIMPYFMHPFQYHFNRHNQLATLRGISRRIRVFFSGGLRQHQYNHHLPGNKMTRIGITHSLLSLPYIIKLRNSVHFEKILENDYVNKCLISDRDQFAIPDRAWLPTLAKSDFFLAPPGMIMPMCHNVIEAMAVGTVPILNYPEWFHPPLQHKINSLVFSDEKGLHSAIEVALTMPQEKIKLMRKQVCRYYDQHLTPSSFRERLETIESDNVALFVNTDQPQYSSKVHKSSIIIRR